MLPTYAFLDPASGKVKVQKIRAQSAICVIHPDSIGRIFVLEAWADRVPTSTLVEKVYAINDRWKPKVFGCEANAMQSLFVDLFQENAKLQGKRLPLVPVHQPTQIDKDFRIRTIIQPILNRHALFLRHDPDTDVLLPGMTALYEQLKHAPGGTLKDLIDALASVIELAPSRTFTSETQHERDSLIAYHRRIGSTNTHIRQRLEQFDRTATIPPNNSPSFDV